MWPSTRGAIQRTSRLIPHLDADPHLMKDPCMKTARDWFEGVMVRVVRLGAVVT